MTTASDGVMDTMGDNRRPESTTSAKGPNCATESAMGPTVNDKLLSVWVPSPVKKTGVELLKPLFLSTPNLATGRLEEPSGRTPRKVSGVENDALGRPKVKFEGRGL